MKKELAGLRAKKVGVVLAQMRENRSQTVDNCAAWLGITPPEYHQFESGEKSPSLPQLQSLSLYLGFSFDQFLQADEAGPVETALSAEINQKLLGLQNRKIALLLKHAKTDKGISDVDLSDQAGISLHDLNSYLDDHSPVPFSDLLLLLDTLGLSMSDACSTQAPLAHPPQAESTSGAAFPSSISPEMQEFISKPSNLPYLELAMRFSKMDSEKIRTIASSLLEITY